MPETILVTGSSGLVGSKVWVYFAARGRVVRFGVGSCCLRDGYLTKPNHTGVELQDFLFYLMTCNLAGHKHIIFGYEGKQVGDNKNIAHFIEALIEDMRCVGGYDLGGGRHDSCLILEAFGLAEDVSEKAMVYGYVGRLREGGFEEIHAGWLGRKAAIAA